MGRYLAPRFGPIVILFLAAEQVPRARAQTPAEPPPKVRTEKSVLITARDGVKLSTDLHFPLDASGPFPTILIRTPYSKAGAGIGAARFVSHGYVVAIQDVRGKYESEGVFD